MEEVLCGGRPRNSWIWQVDQTYCEELEIGWFSARCLPRRDPCRWKCQHSSLWIFLYYFIYFLILQLYFTVIYSLVIFQQNRKPSAVDPLTDDQTLKRVAGETERLSKIVEGLDRKSLNGPTNLDKKWKELQEVVVCIWRIYLWPIRLALINIHSFIFGIVHLAEGLWLVCRGTCIQSFMMMWEGCQILSINSQFQFHLWIVIYLSRGILIFTLV